MIDTFSTSTADVVAGEDAPCVGEIDQPTDILLDMRVLVDLAAGNPRRIIVLTMIDGGPRCRIDLEKTARSWCVPRASLARALSRLLSEGVIVRHDDGSTSIDPGWPGATRMDRTTG